MTKTSQIFFKKKIKIIFCWIIILLLYPIIIAEVFAQEDIVEAITPSSKIHVEFRSIELGQALMFFADLAKKTPKISVKIDQTKKVELLITGQTWREALTHFLAKQEIFLQENTHTLSFHPIKTLVSPATQTLSQALSKENAPAEEMVVQVFTPRHTQAKSLFDMIKDKKNLLSSQGNLMLDTQNNQLIVVDYKPRTKIVEEIVKWVDTPLTKIRVSAIISIVKSSSLRKWGFNWFANGNIGSVNIGGRSVYNSSTGLSVQPILTDFAATDANSFLSLGNSSGSDIIRVQLSALASDSEAAILSEPQVLLLSGTTGKISTGQDIPYQTTNENGTTNTHFKEALLELTVTPTVVNDNQIRLEISLRQDSLGDFYKGIPSIDTNYFNTETILNSEESVVVGGIIRKLDLKKVRKIPYLSDVPYIGNLFKYSELQKEDWYLLIFVFPTVLP